MAATLVVVAALSLVAHGQQTPWHPARYQAIVMNETVDRDGSVGYTVAQGRQAGYRIRSSVSRAIIWSGSASQWVDITPTSAGARILGMDEGQQVGFALNIVPCVWNGTAESFVNLLPSGWLSGQATAVHNGRQVGYAFNPQDVPRAVLWTGSPESMVDLGPPGWYAARAYGIYGNVVVGSATQTQGGGGIGGLWRLDTGEFVRLTPGWGLGSFAWGAGPGEQVGKVGNAVTLKSHAVRWNGTPESCVDLMPFGAIQSEAFATNGRQQVGWAFWGGERVWASVWSGSRGTWHDLHQYLPQSLRFIRSEARAIDEEGNIVGFAQIQGTYVPRCVLWRRVQQASFEENE